MPQRLDGPGDAMTPQNCTNLVFTLAYAHALCFLPFLRINFGDQAFAGLSGPIALVMILLVWGSDPTGTMMVFFWLWIAFVLCQRLRMGLNRRNGVAICSQYTGFPAFTMRLFRCKTETQARMIEPVICLLVGIPIMLYVSDVAGKFIAAGAASVSIIEGTYRWIDNRKVQQMRDAKIEAERLSAMYKGRQF
jgi:hypothetical protein